MRYRELGVLAEGGMATVATAERDDGTTVVIKRVRPPFCFDASVLRLFADEGAVHAALDHENIVRLLDRGEDDAGPFLVFEHVDGTDLGVVMDVVKALDVECVLAVAIPLFKALAAAHETRDEAGEPLCVVHRDVSPGNVLIAHDGGVKLADFGVASFTLKSEVTVAGEMKGKFAYMAPEQTRGEKVGPRADLFAAGVVLWECLAGRRLFDGPTDADVVAAVRNQPAPALLELRPALPASFLALVAALLEKDPASRPHSARDVARQLTDTALELGFDEGLSRHAARLARLAPRRELQVRDVDARRRTQRVLGDTATTGIVVRDSRPRSILPALLAASAVVLIAVAAFALRPAPNDVTQLPPSPRALVAGAMSPVTLSSRATPATPATTATIPAAATATPTTATTATTAALAPLIAHGLVRPKASASAALVKAADVPRVDGFGKLTITTEPWASVSVDGKLLVKESPLRGHTLAAGKHTVVVDNPVLHLSRTLEVEVPADAEVKRFVDLNQP